MHDQSASRSPEFQRSVGEGRKQGQRLGVQDRIGGGKRPRGPAFFVDILGDDELLHQAQLIVAVQNGEVRLQPYQFRMTPQQLDANRMKGAQPGHALDRLTQKATNSMLHLAGGLVGKSDSQECFVIVCLWPAQGLQQIIFDQCIGLSATCRGGINSKRMVVFSRNGPGIYQSDLKITILHMFDVYGTSV